MLSETEGWIVGEAGAILHWNGQEWQAVDSPTTFSMQLVVAISTQEAWASGVNRANPTEGVLLHWDGKAWSIFSNPTPLARIISMSFVNETDGWAISQQRGTPYAISHLVHWDGDVWTTMVEAPGLHSLTMLSATNGWAMGGWGTISRWDGSSWQVISPFDADATGLGSMSFVSPKDGWAIRDDQVIMRWNGIEWQAHSSNLGHPRHLLMTSAADGWMSGYDDRANPILLRWDSQSWNLFEGAKPEGEIQGLAATASNDVWAVSNRGGQIWHWDGATWEAYESTPSPRITARMNAMEFVSETDAWLVGDEGLIARWDGQQLIQVMSPTSSNLYDVAFVAPDNGWAVGAGTQILHWNGYSWTVVRSYRPRDPGPSGAFASLTGVDFTSPTEGWAVGLWDTEGGGFLFMLHWDGQQWREPDPGILPEFCECPLTSVTMLTRDDGWATGGYEGTLLHWDGLRWERVSNPANYWLESASGVTSTDVWAVGTQYGSPIGDGIVLHWDGQEWTEAFLSPYGLSAIVMLSAVKGWAAGWMGQTVRWNGTEWRAAASPVLHQIVDLKVSPNGIVWAVASTGALLYPTTP